MTREELDKLTDILDSEVLGNFMHGGEAAEVIAMFEDKVEESELIKEEPVSEQKLSNVERIGKNWKEEPGLNWKEMSLQEKKDLLASLQKDIEPASENLKQAIDTYLATYFGGEKEKQEWPFLKKMAIHFAEWQKEQMMTDAVDGFVEEPVMFQWRIVSNDIEGEFVVKNKLTDGDKVKLIIIKED